MENLKRNLLLSALYLGIGIAGYFCGWNDGRKIGYGEAIKDVGHHKVLVGDVEGNISNCVDDRLISCGNTEHKISCCK